MLQRVDLKAERRWNIWDAAGSKILSGFRGGGECFGVLFWVVLVLVGFCGGLYVVFFCFFRPCGLGFASQHCSSREYSGGGAVVAGFDSHLNVLEPVQFPCLKEPPTIHNDK